MRRTRNWTRSWRRWAALVLAVGFVALLGGAAELLHESDTVLQRATPHAVWDLLADFSLTADFIPGLIEFKIVQEKSDSKEWQYTVNYSSHTSWWPHQLASTVAHFMVPHGHGDHLVIRSTHRTCYFFNLCLSWHIETQLSSAATTGGGGGVGGTSTTLVRERVRYQCPRLLSAVCRSHVHRDRAIYISVLKTRFL